MSLFCLVGAGAVVKQQVNQSKCAALWSSAELGEDADVQRLLESGTDPDCQCGEAMKRAKKSGYQDTVELLKRYGAKADSNK